MTTLGGIDFFDNCVQFNDSYTIQFCKFPNVFCSVKTIINYLPKAQMPIHQYNNFQFIYTTGTDDQLEQDLLNNYRINELDVEDISEDTQLSKIEVRSDYIYIALQFPVFDKFRKTFLTKEIHCFVSNSWVYIVNKQSYKHFEQFVNFQKQLLEDEEVITSYMFLAELLDFCMTKTYKAIMKFKVDIAQIETDLFEFTDDIDVLKDILIVKKNLVNFESVIEPFQQVISDLETKNKHRLTTNELERFDNSLDTINKILNNLQNFKEQIDLLTQTNDSMMNRNSNINSRNLNIMVLAGFVMLVTLNLASLFRLGSVDGNWIFGFLCLVIVVLIGIGFWIISSRDK